MPLTTPVAPLRNKPSGSGGTTEYSQYAFTTGACSREEPTVTTTADGEYASVGGGAAPQESAISLIANCDVQPASTHHSPNLSPQKSIR